MQRLYSVILTIICGMCFALPLRAATSVNIPLYYDSSDDGNITIQSITADNSGSTTVTPVDPNLIRAELCDNILVIHENIPDVIFLTVTNQNNGQRIVFAEPIDNTTSVELEEMATYLIFIDIQGRETITGKFSYPYIAGEKQMLNGQLYIRAENGVYTLQGTRYQ